MILKLLVEQEDKTMLKRIFLLMFFAAVSVNAVEVGGVECEAVVGSGVNTAYMIIDFDTEQSGDEYVFAYLFDGVKTTQDAIDAYEASAIGLSFTTNWGFIDGVTYNNMRINGVWNDLAENYWAFDVSENGTDWTYSSVGVAERVLADGSWDKLYMSISAHSDFAVWVTDDSGNFTASGLYDDAGAVLGMPVTDYVGEWDEGTSKIVQSAYGEDLDGNNVLVKIFAGDYVVAKFDHKVANDPNNLYGVDFVVFHNGFYSTSSVPDGYVDDNTDMSEVIVSTALLTDINGGLKVSVSQDGVNWYTYEDGPYGYGKAYPSQAYNWDQDQYDATGNGWSELADPLKPVDPQLNSKLSNSSTMSAAAIIAEYNGSAGGTGFDLAPSGFEWIKYVKVEANDGYQYGTVDAISDVAACGDYKHPYPAGDRNEDCRVDLEDFALFAASWGQCIWDCDN
jgi:hypothetical protein